MPGRNIILSTNKIYHIFNRGVASQPIFLNKRDYDRALQTFLYYQNKTQPIKYSKFLELSRAKKEKLLLELKNKKEFLCEIIAFCFMPTHFHFLLKQKKDNGISKLLAYFSNSYARYFNTKKERSGALFQGRFKAVRVETEEQLVHLSRYIHLNPYTSHQVKSFKNLKNYPHSSFREYLGIVKTNFCYKKTVLHNFKSIKDYEKFVFDQADYQQALEENKHLVLETETI